MTGAKAWRQKGTGRARAGALSVPQRTGGGVAFGPKPRSYTVKVNRKERRRALRAALSVHAARGSARGRRRRSLLRRALDQDRRRGPRRVTRSGVQAAAVAERWWCWWRARRTPCSASATSTGVDRAARRRRGRGRRDRRGPADRLGGRARAPDPGGHRAREGGQRRMNARNVIIRPVISEKSYALLAANKYTFRVHDARQQDPGPPGGGGDLRRARPGRAHAEREAQAQAARLHRRQAPRVEEGRRDAPPRRLASSCSRARRST